MVCSKKVRSFIQTDRQTDKQADRNKQTFILTKLRSLFQHQFQQKRSVTATPNCVLISHNNRKAPAGFISSFIEKKSLKFFTISHREKREKIQFETFSHQKK
jgi:hypothetical protein